MGLIHLETFRGVACFRNVSTLAALSRDLANAVALFFGVHDGTRAHLDRVDAYSGNVHLADCKRCRRRVRSKIRLSTGFQHQQTVFQNADVRAITRRVVDLEQTDPGNYELGIQGSTL